MTCGITILKPLTPDEPGYEYPVLGRLRDIAIYNSTLSQGIAYYASWRGFYGIPTLTIGAGPQFRDLSDDFIKPWGVAFKVNLKFVLGYQGEYFLFSLQGVNNSDVLILKSEDLQFHSGQVILSFGYAF